MTSIVEYSESSWGEWHFRLLGIPIRVQPWFWLMILILGAQQETGAVVIWVAVCFVSILVHEIGHVIAFRLFGYRSEVVLYAWGGLTVPEIRSPSGALQQVFVAVAGPLAGFVLGVLVCMVAVQAGAEIRIGFLKFLPSISALIAPSGQTGPALRALIYKNVLINDLLIVNFYWGLVNLLPIYPLDGGRVARALFEDHDAFGGYRRALLLSGICAALVALIGVANGDMYLVLMFGVLAATSLQMREAAFSRRR